MTMDFQPSVTYSHLTLFAFSEAEEASEETATQDTQLDLSKNISKEMKHDSLNSKQHTFSQVSKKTFEKIFEPKSAEKAFSSALSEKVEKAVKTFSEQSLSLIPTYQKPQKLSEPAPFFTQGKNSQAEKKEIKQSIAPLKESSSKEIHEKKTHLSCQNKNLQKAETTTTRPTDTLSRKFCFQSTHDFWENRVLQKESKEARERDQRRQDQNQEQEQKEKKPLIEKVQKSSSLFNEKENDQSKHQIEKPILERPKTGIFALYYILTKIGIFSDASSSFAYKKEIEDLDNQMTAAHKQRLEEMKKALKKEASSRRWSIAEKIFSWMGSLIGIISGAILIATGVGAIMGAMMIAAGVMQITNQILEMTGGWHKIAELLPGDDPAKKRAVVSWMQIGIAVLSLILAGIGVIWGGVSTFKEAMSMAQTAMSTIATTGHGVGEIGKGISTYHYKDAFGEMKRYEKELARLKHLRQDVMDKIDMGVDRIEQLFEDLSRALEFEVELFRADQMVNR